MKAKIINTSANELTILCPSHKYEIGQDVIIEDATKGSNNQNRLFHELINIWISSGCSSYEGDLQQVKDYIKRDMGCGFESYIYADDNAKIIKTKGFNSIPEHIRTDYTRCLGKLKSWSNYTKRQRMNCISNLIDNMCNSGVNSREFDDILKEVNNG